MPAAALHRGIGLTSLFAGMALCAALSGCQLDRPPVEADAADITGIANAIVFREAVESTMAAPDSGQTLGLGQAVRLALANDPRIQASLARVRAAEADARQARLLPNPILTIDIRFPVKHGSNTVFEPSLTADLVSLLQKPAQISAADNLLRASASTALVTVLDVMAEVEQSFALCVSADANIQNAGRQLEQLRKLRDLAQKRLDAGDAVRLDLLTLESQRLLAEFGLSDLKLRRVEHRLALARLTGQPRSDLSWQLSAWEPIAETTVPGESAWIDTALCRRPEILAHVWELHALGDEVNVASLAPLQGGEVGAHAEHDPEWRIGPVIATPLPIFDWGQAATQKAMALRIAARHELAQQRLEVIQDVRTAYVTYLHALASLAEFNDKLLPLQKKQVEQTRTAYSAGDIDLATLLLAENQSEATLTKEIELQEQMTLARIKLQRAAGGAGVAGRLEAAATQPAAGSNR